MGVEEYINAKKRAEKLDATIEHNLFKSITQGLDQLYNEDNELDLEKIKDAHLREQFTDSLYSRLVEFTTEHGNIDTEDELLISQFTYSLFGFSKENITTYLDENNETFKIGELLVHIKSNTPYGFFQSQRNIEHPKSKLSITDVEEVIEYTGVKDNVDKDKLTKNDLTELLNEFEKERIISPLFINDKDYAIN